MINLEMRTRNICSQPLRITAPGIVHRKASAVSSEKASSVSSVRTNCCDKKKFSSKDVISVLPEKPEEKQRSQRKATVSSYTSHGSGPENTLTFRSHPDSDSETSFSALSSSNYEMSEHMATSPDQKRKFLVPVSECENNLDFGKFVLPPSD